MTNEFPDDVPSESNADVMRPASTSDGQWLDSSEPRMGYLQRKPGPGFWESIAWIVGFFIVQLIAGVVVSGIIFGFEVVDQAQGGAIKFQNIDKKVLMEQAMKEHAIWLIGGIQVIMLLVVIPAVTLRLGIKNSFSRLSVGRLRMGHFALLCALFIPALMFCNLLHMFTKQILEEYIFPHLPFVQNMEELSSMELMKDMQSAPLLAILFAMAFAPAVVEELLFRGLIGRGLVARKGLVPGIIVTSVLFGMVHMAPAHVISVIPLAVVMQLLHLTTRTIWAPILFHFCFNAVACLTLKFTTVEQLAKQLEEPADFSLIQLLVMIASGVILIALCWLLWMVRTRYYTPDGQEYPAGYYAPDIPEQEPFVVHAYGS